MGDDIKGRVLKIRSTVRGTKSDQNICVRVGINGIRSSRLNTHGEKGGRGRLKPRMSTSRSIRERKNLCHAGRKKFTRKEGKEKLPKNVKTTKKNGGGVYLTKRTIHARTEEVRIPARGRRDMEKKSLVVAWVCERVL